MRRGTSKATTKANFREFGKGRTYSRTKRRFGKKRADKQRIAAVLHNKRKSTRRLKHRAR
jgi:hypothetical protein